MISLEKVTDSVNRYLALQKIVELGSFTRAAEALGYTQSAMSQMISSLEEELSIKLLIRSRTGARLMLEGQSCTPMWSGWSASIGRRRRRPTRSRAWRPAWSAWGRWPASPSTGCRGCCGIFRPGIPRPGVRAPALKILRKNLKIGLAFSGEVW